MNGTEFIGMLVFCCEHTDHLLLPSICCGPVSVSVCVCHKLELILQQPNESSWFLAWELLLTYPAVFLGNLSTFANEGTFL